MKRNMTAVALAVALLLAIGANAATRTLTVPAKTDVVLAFDQAVSSKTAKAGQTVALHVKNPVVVDGKTVIARGTKVTGVISQVDRRQRYGINAKLRIVLNPVRSVYGGTIPIQPRTKGKYVSGSKSSEAGAATVGGAVLLGPAGLIGGFFIHGKPVNIKPGDQIVTEVAKNTVLTIASSPRK